MKSFALLDFLQLVSPKHLKLMLLLLLLLMVEVLSLLVGKLVRRIREISGWLG